MKERNDVERITSGLGGYRSSPQ